MAFSVDDFNALLRLLDERPDLREQLRRYIIPDELLRLPALVAQIADQLIVLTERVGALVEAQARTEARVSELAEAQARTEARLEDLAEAQARTEARVSELAEAQARTEARLAEFQAQTERRFAEAEARSDQRFAEAQARNDAHFARVEDRLGRLEGGMFEIRFTNRAAAYLGRLIGRAQVIDTSTLANLLDDAVEQGRLTPDDRDEVMRVDLVVSGRRREDQADIYVIVEISAGIRPHDVERASVRAGIMARLGRPTIPVVAGDSINSAAVELARTRGVWRVLDGHVTAPDAA